MRRAADGRLPRNCGAAPRQRLAAAAPCRYHPGVRRALAFASLLAVLAPASVPARDDAGGRLAVFAASSLTEAFGALDRRPNYSFAGSDQLAFQIRQGARADVFAAASPRAPRQLYEQGLVERPVAFATNRLVLIVPRANRAGIRTLDDLARPGVKIVVGDRSVPVGAYTLAVLERLGIAAAVERNVVSREPDAKSVTAKVALGEADAGFVYVTDARSVRTKVRAIALRAAAQPKVVYTVAVVKRRKDPQAARRFVASLLRTPAQNVLVRYGFGRRP